MRTGRPTKLTAVYDVRELDGRRVERTIGEALCDFVRLGHFMETACALVGINSDTAREWIRVGRRAVDRLNAGARRRDLTAQERRCADFSVAVAGALAEAEHRDLRRLAALAAGGLPQVTVVEEHELDADGQERLVKRTTRRTESMPDAATLRWRLERRFPNRWGRQERLDDEDLDDSGDDWGPDPVAEAERRLGDMRRRMNETTEALAAIGELDILDAEIVDELPPDDS